MRKLSMWILRREKMNCLKTCPLRLSPHPSSPSKPVKLSTTLNKQKWSRGGGEGVPFSVEKSSKSTK
jgi:hypothetical protein